MKTRSETWVSRKGLASFVELNILVMKYYFILFFHFLHFFEFHKSKSTQILRPQKGNSGVLFNRPLLNFSLR